MSTALRYALVLPWGMWLLSTSPAHAQAPLPPAAAQSRAAGVAVDEGHPVLLDGEEVFRLHGGTVGSFLLEDRVRLAEERVLRIAEDPFYAHGLITTERGDEGVWIRYRGATVGLVDDGTALRLDTTPEQRAAEIVEAMEEAVARYRERRRPEQWTRAALLLGVASLALVGALSLIGIAHRRLARWIEARRARLSVGGQPVGFRSAVRLTALQLRGLRLVRTALVVVVGFIYLEVAFTIVPLTRSFALSVLEYVLDPLRVVWQGLLANVGNLFFIAVVVAMARVFLRGLNLLLGEAALGTLHLPGIPRDRALPLYKIVRLIVVAIAVVMIYPYVPGSSTAAFQGISLFAGALFTLGASSTASNFIGGMVLVFSGAFQIGDRVEIGGVTGDVEESTLALTRLRTPRNELVTFANATVVSQGFINYSTLARKQGVIVASEVTIGYDVPWRKVHELLLEAARATADVLEDPEPFVFQTALNDFHVGYRVHVYTRNANAMPRIRSELHQNIQDAFARGAVEILSPAYAALRDGRASTIPGIGGS